MGKLIDTLNRSGQDSGPKLGFGARRLDKAPSFMIVAQLAKLDKISAAAAVKNGASAIMGPASARKKGTGDAAKALGLDDGVACGSAGLASSADFSIVDPSQPLEDSLSNQDTDLVLSISPEASDEMIRALEALPIDAIVLEAPTPPESIEDLVPYYRVARSTSKPILARAPLDVTEAHLIALRDAGVSGLLVEVGANQYDALRSLNGRIRDLPAPKRRTKQRTGTPSLGLSSQGRLDDAHDDADDDDDEDDE